MGITSISAIIRNLANPDKSITGNFIVDTGAAYTVIPQAMAEKLNLVATKTQEFTLADGRVVKRKLAHAMVEIGQEKAPSTVVIGQKGDSALLGVITLENMGLMVDPFKRKLLPMRLMLA